MRGPPPVPYRHRPCRHRLPDGATGASPPRPVRAAVAGSSSRPAPAVRVPAGVSARVASCACVCVHAPCVCCARRRRSLPHGWHRVMPTPVPRPPSAARGDRVGPDRRVARRACKPGPARIARVGREPEPRTLDRNRNPEPGARTVHRRPPGVGGRRAQARLWRRGVRKIRARQVMSITENVSSGTAWRTLAELDRPPVCRILPSVCFRRHCVTGWMLCDEMSHSVTARCDPAPDSPAARQAKPPTTPSFRGIHPCPSASPLRCCPWPSWPRWV